MSRKSDLVSKLRILVELRQKTIQANKRQMKENLKEYKKNLELDRKLKDECRTLQETIYRLLTKNNSHTTHFKNKKVLPKENRAVFFDPSIPHSSSLCTDEKRRVTINFNYF